VTSDRFIGMAKISESGSVASKQYQWQYHRQQPYRKYGMAWRMAKNSVAYS